MKYGITREMIETGLSAEQWDQIVGEARQFAANACQSINNSIDPAFGARKQQELPK